MPRALLLLLPLLAAGCALTRTPLRQSTTPLEADPATAADPAAGVIYRGFTADQVQRALGTPPQIRTKASGQTLASTWIYPNSAGGSTHVVFAGERVADILHIR